MQTFYVVFVRRNHGVYYSCLECQKNVFFYKRSVYNSYTSKEQVLRAWVLYEPRWRLDESSIPAMPKSQHEVVDEYPKQKVSNGSVISFSIRFFVACGFMIVISKFTYVVHMCCGSEFLLSWYS